jgi:phosphoenolpyruvate-protein kinase (PTS system EI component)
MIRTLGNAIPTVIISREQATQLTEGETLLLDGTSGTLLKDEEMAQVASRGPITTGVSTVPLKTRDQHVVELRASTGSHEAIARAVTNGATAIGSLRTEYLGFDRKTPPTAEFYEKELNRCCEQAAPLSVTIRLPDITLDKLPAWCSGLELMDSPLGIHGARLYNYEPVKSVFQSILMASTCIATRYDIQLMLPYVTLPEEFEQLQDEINKTVAKPLPIGTMIETPSAALMIAEFLNKADFVSIGCNDLMQCVYAADRDIYEVKNLLDPYAPAVYRLLRYVADEAGDRINKVQLCGLLACFPEVMQVLLGMGYRAFSVYPMYIPSLAQTISKIDTEHAKQLADKICAADSIERVKNVLKIN